MGIEVLRRRHCASGLWGPSRGVQKTRLERLKDVQRFLLKVCKLHGDLFIVYHIVKSSIEDDD